MKKKIAGKKVNVIFCGLMRKPEILKKSIQDLINFRKKGLVDKIVYSTWDYEVENNKEIANFLKENKVEVIGSKEPEVRGIGNIFCQMKSLEVGLASVNKKSFVFKTRSDLYINQEFLEKLLKRKENLLKINHSLPKGNIFKYKIWAPYFEITSPFHLGDECFFGLHGDVSKLVNYIDYYKELNLLGGVAHIQRYLHPFINDYPEIKIFFQSDSDVGFPRDESFSYKIIKKISKKFNFLSSMLDNLTVSNRFRILNKRFKEENYLKILAAYYTILYSHFYIDNSGVDNDLNNNGIFNRNSHPKEGLSSAEIMENFNKSKISVKSKGQIYSLDERFLKNIFEYKTDQKDTRGTNLLNKINQFNLS